jgi:predicted nucleic acid-binding protein
MTWRARNAIADTSTLLYLHYAGKLDLLANLFASTVVPDAVCAELRAGALAGIDVPDVHDFSWAAVRSPMPERLALVTPCLLEAEE